MFAGVVAPEALLGECWQRFLWGWVTALGYLLSIAAVERRNRRTRTVISKPQMTWQHYVAATLIRESVQISDAMAARDYAVAGMCNVLLDEAADDAEERVKRGKSVYEVFLDDAFSECRAIGGGAMNKIGFSTEWRNEQRLNFLALQNASRRGDREGPYRSEEIGRH